MINEHLLYIFNSREAEGFNTRNFDFSEIDKILGVKKEDYALPEVDQFELDLQEWDQIERITQEEKQKIFRC